jgi:hypothetical protein
MGHNKKERRVIAGLLKHIEIHEQKIKEEQTRDVPNQSLITKWRTEIQAAEATIIRRAKRLPGGEL